MSIRSALVAATLGLAALSATAQDPNGGGAPPQGGGQGGGQGGQQGGGGGGNNRRGGGWDPARMMEMMKEQLKAQDDEWKVIEPKLTKVFEAQRDARSGGMGFGGRGGPGGGGGGGGRDNNNPDQPQSEVQKAGRELRTTLQNDGASASDIEAKLKAFREARDKAQEALKTAREDLKSVLTQRQEAVLVMSGMLE